MSPNERCWCHSGLKWKKCHKDRSKLSPIPQSEVFEHTKEISEQPMCLHPLAGGSCGRRIIDAHTVQRRVGLKAIEEDGHVLSARRSLGAMFENAGTFVPQRQGVRRASTFRGFCDKHDAELFRPIETKSWDANKENAFLFSFRAVAYETHAKLAAKRIGLWQKTWIDRGDNFFEQATSQQFLANYLTGVELGIKDSLVWKEKFDRIYRHSAYSDYHYLCIEFRPALPIVTCGGMHVEWDFNGRELQNIIREAPSYEHLTFNITASDDVSLVIFGWVGDPTGPSYQFLQSLLSQPVERLSQAVIRLAFEYFENTFMRQSWWEGLGPSAQGTIKRHALSGGPRTGRQATCLQDDGADFFPASASINEIIM
jgi:hypothetical protein